MSSARAALARLATCGLLAVPLIAGAQQAGDRSARIGWLAFRAPSPKHRLPAVCSFRDFVDAGDLMSFGSDPGDLARRAATYVDKILEGAKPADLPVEQPTKFELVINLKAAKALRLTLPPSLLGRADHVIE
ncbi:MAG TPA: ABC transporter substrate binding protein [Candidatus Binatia bacterium]|nr:ABC transporter substrate binding protein [Candidatus Binatia bacterium]